MKAVKKEYGKLTLTPDEIVKGYYHLKRKGYWPTFIPVEHIGLKSPLYGTTYPDNSVLYNSPGFLISYRNKWRTVYI